MKNIISKWKEAITTILGEDEVNAHLEKQTVKIELIKIFEAEIGRKFPQDFYDFYLNINPINNQISSVFIVESKDGYGYNLLPFSDIPQEYEECKDLNFEEDDWSYDDAEVSSEIHVDNYHNNYWIPIAHDYQGNYLMIDLDPSPSGTYGQIIELQNESWSRILVANSLKELLENQLEKLKDENHVKELYAFELEEIEKNKLQNFFDNEIKKELENEVRKGLYSTKDIIERVLDEDEENFKALKKITKAAIKSYKKELSEQLEKGEFQDVDKLQKVLKNLETEHNIITPYVIGYTQDESIYGAETLLNEKGAKGFVYFTEQDIERVVEEKYNFFLGFNCSERNNDPDYIRGIAVGKNIVEALENIGFEVEWDGTMDTRICIKNFLWRCLGYYSKTIDSESENVLEFSSIENNENTNEKYELTIENLKKIINSDRVPNNSDGLDLNIDGVDITIKKPYIDSDGDARGNSIFIDSNSGLHLFLSIDIEYISFLYKTNKDDKFVILDQNSPKSIQSFADSIWTKMINKMDELEDENGLSLQKFKAQFGKHTIPADLLQLYDFGKKHGQYDYSENFYLGNFDKTGLKTYSKNGTFLNAFIEFAGANGTGSSYGFWVLNEDLNECPVVIFGDEGGIQVIAVNFRQLLQLLSFDHEPSVSYDEVYFYFDEEDEDYEHSESHEEYVLWLQLNFGLQPITTDEETELIIEKAQQKYQKLLNEFIGQYETKEVDYTILNTASIQLVPFTAVKHFIPADSWIFKKYENEENHYQNVLFIDGDWIIENIDLADPFHGLNENQIKLYSETASLFIINGNLKAKNIYSSTDDGAFGLLVTGTIEADNMVVGSSDIIINKDLKIKDLFWGSYNHGGLTVDGFISARVFMVSGEYHFDYENVTKWDVEFYLNDADEEFDEDKERMVELAEEFFIPHLPIFEVENMEEDYDDYEDICSWSDLVRRESLINVLKTGYPVLKSEFDYTTNYYTEEEEEEEIPALFPNYQFATEAELQKQIPNFIKIISFLEDDKPEQSFRSFGHNANVFISKQHFRESDNVKVDAQIAILTDEGAEIYLWQKNLNPLKNMFKKEIPLIAVYKDTSANVFAPRFVFDNKKILNIVQKIWAEIIERFEKGIYYKNNFDTVVQTADIASLLQLPMILEEYPNSWNDSDQCPWFGNSCYSFFQGTDTNFPAIKIVKEIDNINNDFDAKSYYYWFDNNTQKATLGYLANYHELNDPLYDMRYSKESDDVPFYHYPLYQEAIKLWKKALVVLPNENEKYVAKKKSEYQMEFSETEVEYRKYYIEKPITENKLADLTYENFNILANYCETCDRSYTYDFFVIIRDYHWISVKLTQEWSLHSVTQKKALKFIFLDEPFGNDTENENYAALKYNVEIDVNNYLSFSTNAETDVDAEKNIQFLLFQLLKDIKKTAPYFIIPNNAEAAQDELNSTIKKNQEQIFGSRFVKSKKDNGGFWENGIWDKDYFYSFQVWEENNLDIRISWTHPEKSQLDNLSNNMQVATIRFNKDTKQITYYFQTTFENDIAIENFEFDLNQIEKIVIGYHLMMQKVKLESESLKEINKKNTEKQNYQVIKPFETIEIEGITFTLKDRLEATEILDQCTDFDNAKVYDPFYISHLENDEEDYKSFFLVAENEVIAEKLNLDTYPPDSEDIYILGYIFLKNIILNKYVEAYDLDFSPPLICMDDVEIGSLLLAGNTFYFHKNLKCVNLHGEYNHGNLIAKGRTDADFIFADDFNMKFNEPSMVVSCSSDSDIEKINDVSTLDLNIDYELNYLPAMHNLQHCVQDRFIYLDGEYGYRIKDEGYRTGINQYAEGEETFFDCLRKGESVLDYEKLETNRTMFIANAFAIAKGMFAKHENLKDLALGEVYYLFPNPNYNHINFYFQETDEFYFIGYWNTWFNISISVGLHKSGEKDQHQLTVFYWNKENTATRYSFTVSMDEMTHYNNICQKVFIEAIERMG